MGSLAVQHLESTTEESDSYFFRRLGELCFTAAPTDPDVEYARGPGRIRRLAVGINSGWMAFADPAGVYVAQTENLLAATTLGDDFTTELLPPMDPGKVCAASWKQADVVSLSLSADENLLAVCSNTSATVFHMHALAGGSTAPLTSWQLPAGSKLRQFAWRPGAEYQAAVVTQDGQLLIGRPGGTLKGLEGAPPKPSPVRCCCWSASGDLLALGGAGATITLLHYKSMAAVSAVLPCQEAEERECEKLEIDSLAFVGPRALWAAFTLFEDGDREADASATAVLQWAQGEVPPPEVQASEMPPPLFFLPECSAEGSGPYLHVAGFPAWGAYLGSHAKAQDDHVRFIEVDPRGGQPPRTVEVLGQGAALTIPGGLDYSDNFVVGMGVDATVPGAVPHPNPEKADVPAAPLLVIATSDAVLRFFRFACTARNSQAIIHPPRPLPRVAPTPPAATERAAVEPEKAAAVGLPDSESSQEEASLAPSTASASDSDAQSQLRPPSMGAAESASTPAPAPRLPQPEAKRPQTTDFQFAEAPHTPSDAESQGESPGIWKVGQEAKAAATQLPSDDESEAESAVESAVASPPEPLPKAEPEKREAPAVVEKPAGDSQAPEEEKQAAAPIQEEEEEEEEGPQMEEPPQPEARLIGEGEQVEEMEAKFLKSLFDTRKLEAELHFHVAQWEAGRGDQTLAGLGDAQQRFSSLAKGVEELRGHCDALQGSHGELQMKAKALTLFGSAPVGAEQPLEAPLAALMTRVRQQLAQIRRGCEELRLNLEALERRRQAAKSGDELQHQPPFRQLYAAVNNQSLVASKQVERLQELEARLEELGIGRGSALQLEQTKTPNGSGTQGRTWQRSPLSPALSRLLPETPKQGARGLWEGDSGDRLRRRILDLATQPNGTLLVVTAREGLTAERPQTSLPTLRPSPPPASTAVSKPRCTPKFDLERALEEKLPPQPTWAAAPKAAAAVPKLQLSSAPSQAAPRPPTQPPIPSRNLVATAQQLQPKKVTQPPIPSKTLVATAQQLQPTRAAQPPIPSKGLVATAQQLQPGKVAQPPIPSKGLVAAAQSLQPTKGAQPPIPSKGLVATAQQLQPTRPAAAQPPVPPRSLVAAAQQLQPAKASQPPVPPKNLVAAAQQLQLSKPAASQPPIPPKSLVAAAQKLQPKQAAQPPTPAPTQAAMATSSAPAEPPPGQSNKKLDFIGYCEVINTPADDAKKRLDFGSQPMGPSSPQPASSEASVGSTSGADKAAAQVQTPKAAGPAATPAATPGPFSFSAPTSGGFAWPASQAASPFSAPSQPAGTGRPWQASHPDCSGALLDFLSPNGAQVPAPKRNTTLARILAAAPVTGSLFGTTASTAPSLFGSLSQPASSSASFGATTAASSSGLDFGGLGLGGGSSGAAPAASGSPFGQLLQQGASSSQSTFRASSAEFGASSTSFGAPSAPFGASSSAFGASTTGFGASSSGFGVTTAGFGTIGAASQPAGGFGAPAASSSSFGGFQSSGSGFGQGGFSSGFGQPSTPGFGQVSTPGFGTPSAPGFGAPASPGFGAPATPGGFGSPAPAVGGGNGFGGFASQPGGFGAFSSQSGGFGAAASQGGGFGAAATQGGGFGAAATQGTGFGGGGFGGAAAQGGFGSVGGGFGTPASSTGNSAMWQMRK